MAKWIVTLGGSDEESEEDFSLELDDISSVFEGYVGFKTKHFEELMDLVGSNEKYNATRSIKSIESPTKSSVPYEGMVLLFCVDQEELSYGILLFVTEKDTVILAVWPEPFFEAVKERNEILNNIISAIIENSEILKRVDVLFPI